MAKANSVIKHAREPKLAAEVKFESARGFANQRLGKNPIGIAYGMKYAGHQPVLVEFSVVQHIGAGLEGINSPAMRSLGEEVRIE